MTSAPAPYISPPSDDSEDADNAFAPIVMVPIAGGCKAMLGVNEIGYVRALDAGKFLAFWRSRLPGADCTPRPVTSIEFGQQRLAEAIRDWFAACGHPLSIEGKK